MKPRYAVLVSLSLLGCPAESDSNDTGGTGTDGSSTGADPTNATAPTTNPDPSTTSAGSVSATGGSTGAATGVDPDTGAESSTGEPPPVGTPGCRAPEPLAEGEHTFMLDGYDRRYILRLPQNYTPDQPWPLIFALHGNGGNPDYWDQIGGDRDIRTAFADEAILVIVEAIDNQWRDYGADPATWPARIELELTYFDYVYEETKNGLCINEDNVFSMGFSGGGSFSGVLGCRRGYIRAIAVGGSVIYFEEADCTETPGAWITIGDGELTAGREAFRDFFRDHAGCADTSTPGSPGGCIDYDGCGPDDPVTFCSHPAGHVWPSIGTDATKAFFQGFYL